MATGVEKLEPIWWVPILSWEYLFVLTDWKRISEKNCLYPGPDYTNVFSFSLFINSYRKIPGRGFAFLINKKVKYIRTNVLKSEQKRKNQILKSSTFLFYLATWLIYLPCLWIHSIIKANFTIFNTFVKFPLNLVILWNLP